jgi:hypothetical protein
VSDATPTTMQRLLAGEFERRGWPYDLAVMGDLIDAITSAGSVDPAALARRVPARYRDSNDVSVDDLEDAIRRALGGRTPATEPRAVTLVINDHSHRLTLEKGASIRDSNINVSGTQIVVQSTATKDEVLAGVAALVRAGLAGGWNVDAARELADLIDARDDVAYEDVHDVTVEVLDEQSPKRSRAKELLGQIAASGIGGALSTGITAGVGELLGQLPT